MSKIGPKQKLNHKGMPEPAKKHQASTPQKKYRSQRK